MLVSGCEGCGLAAQPPADAGLRDGEAPAIEGAVALLVEPTSVTLITDGSSRPSQVFVVRAELEDGSQRDVTDEVGLSLTDAALGALEGARFVSAARAGSTALVARAGTLEARAEIGVRLEIELNADDPSLPSDPGAVFDSAPSDASRAPSLVYPSDGVLVPPNLGILEVHFFPGEGNELFAVRYESSLASVVVYTRCEALGGGCVYTPSVDAWRYVSDTHRGVDEPVTISVKGTDDNGGGQGESAAVGVHVGAEDVTGGLYYWTTTERAIMRVDFGARAQVPERFYPPVGQNQTCYGCHALSPDGTRMSLSQDGQYDGELTLLDVSTRTPLLAASGDVKEQFQAWDPTSTMFAAIYGDDDPPDTHLRIRDGDNGAVLDSIDVGSEISHPHWSPLGHRIAFTVVTRHQTSQRPGRGGLSYVEEVAGAWSTPRELLPPVDGKNRYTPVYSPDGSYLVYVESLCPDGEIYTAACDADADDVAKLWALPSDGGTPIRLARAGGAGPLDDDEDLANTYPRWAPFEDPRYSDGEGRVQWLTFSSRRRYGLRDPEGRQLLWMVAIDPDRIAQGEDGSYPAFALPFQDLGTSNHMAQWTEVFVPTDPDPDDDAGPDPETCLTAGELCAFGADECCPGLTCVVNEAASVCVGG